MVADTDGHLVSGDIEYRFAESRGGPGNQKKGYGDFTGVVDMETTTLVIDGGEFRHAGAKAHVNPVTGPLFIFEHTALVAIA